MLVVVKDVQEVLAAGGVVNRGQGSADDALLIQLRSTNAHATDGTANLSHLVRNGVFGELEPFLG